MSIALTNVNIKKPPPLYGEIHSNIQRRRLWGVGLPSKTLLNINMCMCERWRELARGLARKKFARVRECVCVRMVLFIVAREVVTFYWSV
jgi:hypothetical protein